jgi:hypothetical protein
MHIFDNFEKRFLFGLTRLFAMVIILGILVSISIGGVFYADFFGGINTKVNAVEVINAIKPPELIQPISTNKDLSNQTTVNVNGLPSVKLPFILQKYFNSPEKVQMLKSWLDSLSESYHQEFIDEMAIIIAESEKLKLSSDEAINKYKELKFKKIELELSEKVEQRTQRLYLAGAFVSAVALIALFSLILVLLAIERNTRRIDK